MARLVFDIDGTIGTSFPPGEYEKAQPIKEMVDLVNRLHEQGHHIIIFTARGMGFSEGNVAKAYQKCYTLTYNQLQSWGVKFHELILGKPHADLYIDDRGFRVYEDQNSSIGLEYFINNVLGK